MSENENANAQNAAAQRAAMANQMRAQAVLGGDFADPATMIMQNARKPRSDQRTGR